MNSITVRIVILFLLSTSSALGQGGSTDTSGVESRRSSPDRGRSTGMPSRGGSEVVPLGSGRGRLRLTLSGAESIPVSDGGTVALQGDTFLSRWLRRELSRRFPGVDVEVVEVVRAIARDGALNATRERAVILTGEVETLERVRAMAATLTRLEKTRIELDLRVYAADEDAGEQLPEPGVVNRLVPAAELERRVEDLERRERWTRLARFEHTIENGAEARLRRLVEHSYYKDWEVEITGGDPVAVPVIGKALEGVQARFGALLGPDGRSVFAEVEVGVGAVLRYPFESMEVVIPDVGRRRVDLPEVATVAWRADELELSGDRAGFVVTGLLHPSRQGESGQARPMIVVCSLRVAAPPALSLAGEVLGFDGRQRIAFVKAAAGSEAQPGQRLVFSRAGKVVADGRVVEVVGDVLTVSLREGAVKPGDEAR